MLSKSCRRPTNLDSFSLQENTHCLLTEATDTSHCAGPRYFSRKLNATLTAAAKYGSNNVVFLTITASTAYTAVQALGGASSVDAIPHVFEVIRQAVYADLIAGHFCPPGKRVKADYALNVNEWQKRGLPHAHMIAHFPGPMWSAHDVRTLPTSNECVLLR
jgi:hypothetical protein